MFKAFRSLPDSLCQLFFRGRPQQKAVKLAVKVRDVAATFSGIIEDAATLAHEIEVDGKSYNLKNSPHEHRTRTLG